MNVMQRHGPWLPALALAVAAASAPLSAQYPSYEAATTFINDYPHEAGDGVWNEECQGITHDSSHWYLTQNEADCPGGLELPRMWKVPVCQDLGDLNLDTQGVLRECMPEVLRSQGYNHYGDPSYYNHRGTGYILMPLTGHDVCDSLAVFRAADLGYVAIAYCVVARAGSVGVDPEGRVYMTGREERGILRYKLDWDRLRPGFLPLEVDTYLPFEDSSGKNLTLEHQQGIVLSPSGRLLYFVNGFVTKISDADPSWGIHVFDTTRGRRLVELEHSTNGSGRFDFEFHPGGIRQQEPEGVTFWDLDRSCAPRISGQLHVILLQNDLVTDDDVILKHYRSTGWVRAGSTGGEGTLDAPYGNVNGAHAAAWPGSVIRIFAGDYADTGTYSKQVRLEAVDGTVRIGVP